MTKLRFGIIGCGMIANAIAKTIQQSSTTQTTAVASRSIDKAKQFADEHGIEQVFSDWQELVNSNVIDAVYIATPTSLHEPIAIAAAQAGKHILVEKPFTNLASLQGMQTAAQNNHVALMDATHFCHHARTAQIQHTISTDLGKPLALRSAFFFPALERDNIRFNPDKEPMGAVGDMGWYCMRAIVEFLRPDLQDAQASGQILIDPETNAAVGGSGFIQFIDGKTATIDFGYQSNVCLMDLDIIAEHGMLRLDDFVLDWHSSFAFENPNHQTGFTKRSNVQTPNQFEFIHTDNHKPQALQMIDNFVELTKNPDMPKDQQAIQQSLATQNLIDLFWQSASRAPWTTNA